MSRLQEGYQGYFQILSECLNPTIIAKVKYIITKCLSISVSINISYKVIEILSSFYMIQLAMGIETME